MAMSEAAKKIVAGERRKLLRREANAAELRMKRARIDMERAHSNASNSDIRANDEALFRGLRGAVATTATTWSVDVPIEMHTSSSLKAFTDFKKIRIDYPYSAVPDVRGHFNVNSLRTLISDVKGLSYHEVGHIRFTTPYILLWEMTHPSDEPVQGTWHYAWNILEDQRMEAAVVADSPVIAGYFTTMVLKHIVPDDRREPEPSQWLLLAGRRYLPGNIRARFRQMFTEAHGKDACDASLRIIRSYMSATTPQDMWNSVVEFYNLICSLSVPFPSSVDSHAWGIERLNNQTPDKAHETMQRENTRIRNSADDSDSSESDEQEESDSGQSSGNQGQDPSDDVDDAESAASSSGDEESDSPDMGDSDSDNGNAQRESGTGDNNRNDKRGTVGDDIRDLLSDIEEQQKNDKSLDETVRQIHEEAYSKEGSLPYLREIGAQNPAWVAIAEEMAKSMEATLTYYTASESPIWQFRQNRGILDPFAYRTKIGGSNEYRRQFSDTGDQSIDIAVTVMLDNSGSMGGYEHQLGAVAYACKYACDALAIPCTVTAFESNGWLLWAPNDKPQHLSINAMGGTQPDDVLGVLSEHTYGKTHHLVLIMTDGMFSERTSSFPTYGEDGRYFIGFGFGYSAATSLKKYSPHECHSISDLMDIPKHLTGFLASYLR